MSGILLLILLCVIVYPVVRMALGMYRAHQHVKEVLGSLHSQRQNRDDYCQRAGSQQFYGESVESDYVEFEEVVDATEVSRREESQRQWHDADSRVSSESQITDAVWEEVEN